MGRLEKRVVTLTKTVDKFSREKCRDDGFIEALVKQVADTFSTTSTDACLESLMNKFEGRMDMRFRLDASRAKSTIDSMMERLEGKIATLSGESVMEATIAKVEHSLVERLAARASDELLFKIEQKLSVLDRRLNINLTSSSTTGMNGGTNKAEFAIDFRTATRISL